MTDSSQQLTFKKIFYFWLPLAATWLMMSIEGPYLTAFIARSTEPKFNLAAYGVAYSLVLIVEAPIIMIMSASIALVKDTTSFYKLRNFTFAANILITTIILILITPPIFYFITEKLIGLPFEVAKLTHIATIILIPWPAAIGYRRFYQGLLINNNLTKKVAYETIVRLFSMSICAVVLFLTGLAEGVIIGAVSLSFAVVMEALAVRFMVRDTIKKIISDISINSQKVTYKSIYDFYYPLALTSLIGLGVQPLVTFFVGQSRMALESLAVLPVVTSFVFIFRAIGLSYQEVTISLLGEKKYDWKILSGFAFYLAIILVVVLAIIAFTPLSDFWFVTISGLSPSLAEFARLPLMLMFFFQGLTVLISIQRGLLVTDKNTKPVTMATMIEFSVVIISMIVLINLFDFVGAVTAAISFVVARLSANYYLNNKINRSLKKISYEQASEL